MLFSKLPNVGSSIFSHMSKLALEYNAINLAQGFPDFPCSEELIELVYQFMKRGFNQYAPTQGVLMLREAIAAKYKETIAIDICPENEITITSGATEAVYVAISSIINMGDEVIIFEPAFDSYTPVVELCGGVCKYVTLSFPDFSIDWNIVKGSITNRTKLIIVNSPHNPTGTVLREHDVRALSEIVNEFGIFVISDEVYEHIVFDGLKHCSLLEEKSLIGKTFVVSSFGKTFHSTGWRIGYCIAPPVLTSEFRKIHQFTTFSVATPMQYAIAEFLKKRQNYLGLCQFYQDKRDKFRVLLQPSKFKLLPCSGTYFQLLSYENITNEYDYTLALQYTKEIGVATIPLSVFYHDKTDFKVLRVCFAKKDLTLEMAAEKLCKI